MSTPMIDRAMAQIEKQIDAKGLEKSVLRDMRYGNSRNGNAAAEKVCSLYGDAIEISSKSRLLSSITHSLECLAEDDPQPAIRAALEAVRTIK